MPASLRDLVNAIPLYAIKQDLLTVAQGKKNIFSGRILEIEGLPDLKVEQAFELSDASAERSAAGCTVRLNKEPIIEYINSNIVMLKWMIANGYEDERSLGRRIKAMEAWLADPKLLQPDADAEYAAVIEIDLADVHEPIVACPNDPDDVKALSDVAGAKIDEVFIGSCDQHRPLPRGVQAAGRQARHPGQAVGGPPTKMDATQLTEEGHYGVFGTAGARTEMPGCSLCMGNQAQVREGATVMSTSTRNFPNRLGKNTNVYLGSAELAAICSKLGRIPTKEEYMGHGRHQQERRPDLSIPELRQDRGLQGRGRRRRARPPGLRAWTSEKALERSRPFSCCASRARWRPRPFRHARAGACGLVVDVHVVGQTAAGFHLLRQYVAGRAELVVAVRSQRRPSGASRIRMVPRRRSGRCRSTGPRP